MADGRSPGEEVEVDEEMTEESAAKRAEFLRARDRHYSNEAEVMKRASQMMDEDEDEEAPGIPEPDATDDASETDGDAMLENAATSDSSHCHDDHTGINGIGRAT
jgi:protein phosphatase inhibitor 2